VVAHLDEINFANAEPAFTHLNVFSLCIYGVKDNVRVALALAPEPGKAKISSVWVVPDGNMIVRFPHDVIGGANFGL
jgi:hypothetical protein